MAGSWQVIAATCHRDFGLAMRLASHNGRYGTFFQNLYIQQKERRRIEITMGITCHTCHTFFVFGLSKRFRAIATCHQTCHHLGITSKRYTWRPRMPGRLEELGEAA
jgi:RNase P subunit RPR2